MLRLKRRFSQRGEKKQKIDTEHIFPKLLQMQFCGHGYGKSTFAKLTERICNLRSHSKGAPVILVEEDSCANIGWVVVKPCFLRACASEGRSRITDTGSSGAHC